MKEKDRDRSTDRPRLPPKHDWRRQAINNQAYQLPELMLTGKVARVLMERFNLANVLNLYAHHEPVVFVNGKMFKLKYKPADSQNELYHVWLEE